MVGTREKPVAQEFQGKDGQTLTRIIPVEVEGLKVMSMAFFVEPEQAVIWRGPMLHKAITQFLQDTEWGELDYLIIDMPPGTGDVSLTLSQLLDLAGAVVVCSPQQVALLDAVKAVQMSVRSKFLYWELSRICLANSLDAVEHKPRAKSCRFRFGEIP